MTRQLSAGSRDDDALFTIIRSKAHRSRQFSCFSTNPCACSLLLIIALYICNRKKKKKKKKSTTNIIIIIIQNVTLLNPNAKKTRDCAMRNKE